MRYLLRDDDGRYRPMPIYYELGVLTGRLPREAGPVTVTVDVPLAPLPRGAADTVRLTATNRSGQATKVRLWPVGFVTNLGLEATRGRELDRTLELAAGQSVTLAVPVRPTTEARGAYPVGLAVIGETRNALALADLRVAE